MPYLPCIFVRISFTWFKILFPIWVQETNEGGSSRDAAGKTRQLVPQLQWIMLMMLRLLSAQNHLKNSSRCRGWSPSLVHGTKIDFENLYMYLVSRWPYGPIDTPHHYLRDHLSQTFHFINAKDLGSERLWCPRSPSTSVTQLGTSIIALRFLFVPAVPDLLWITNQPHYFMN